MKILCHEPLVRLESIPEKDLEYFQTVIRKLVCDLMPNSDFSAKSSKNPFQLMKLGSFGDI